MLDVINAIEEKSQVGTKATCMVLAEQVGLVYLAFDDLVVFDVIFSAESPPSKT